jgi:hypothetical protein
MDHDAKVAVLIGLIFSIVPTIGIVIVWFQRRAQFDGSNHGFASINQRFDEMILFWRQELHGFEYRQDVKLKRLEAGRADGGHR